MSDKEGGLFATENSLQRESRLVAIKAGSDQSWIGPGELPRSGLIVHTSVGVELEWQAKCTASQVADRMKRKEAY